jgi:phosphohistidine swiveling domain-containing protein
MCVGALKYSSGTIPCVGGVRSEQGGLTVTTTNDEITFPGPDEVEGFWALDKMHAPRPISPLSVDLVMHTLAEGFTKAQAEYDCPIMVTTKEINHYFYVAFHPIPDEAEIADRMTRYHGKLADKVPSIGKTWEEQWKPEVIANNVPLKTADYSGLSDAELIAKLDELTDQMRHQWWIHGHINFVLLSSSAFCDLYDTIMKPDDPTESYQTLHGFQTTSVDASRGLWALSRTVLASPTLKELFETTGPKDLPAKLEASEEGRAFSQQLDEFLFEYGWRHDAVYDLADVPWRENPSIPLASIATMMGLDESEDPEVVYQQKVARRQDLLAKARAKLANEPETLAKFDELYEAARYSFPLTEDHAFYIDQLFISVLRRFALVVGERLVANGVVDDPDDVFYLYRDELVEALTEGGDWRATVAEHRTSVERASRAVAPTTLGTPPPPPEVPDPFMDALVFRLLGMVPPQESADPGALKGVAGSQGVYTGTARVVRSLDEATELEEGEVMVCEMTLPPWVPVFSVASAIVADVGGVLSHTAIVAREFGVPCVVGTEVGTTAIKTGQTITVDGTKGFVYLDGRTVTEATTASTAW